MDWFFSIAAENPVPGGPSFQTVVPGGNIAIFADRWTWITDPTQGMWKLWTDATRNDRVIAANVILRDSADTFNLAPPLR